MEFADSGSSLAGAATEVFQILRSYNYSVQLFDDQGNEVSEPEEARRFFAEPRGIMVALNDSPERCLRLYIGGNTGPMSIQGLARTLRMSAWKFDLLFAFRRFDAKEIKVKDFATNHSVRENAEPYSGDTSMEDITEGMYGTSKSSYLRLENARMIVRHKAKVNEATAGARARSIGSIYIEDGQHQRFLFPTQNLVPARAMLGHVGRGGSFNDQVGNAIKEAAEDYRALLNCRRHCARHGGRLDEGVGKVHEACGTKMTEMRKSFGRLFRESSYHDEAQRLTEQANSLVETEESRESKDARARRLCEMLAVEGVELDEGMMNRVASCIECADLDEEQAPKKRGRPQAGTKGTISVLGAPLNQQAWERFKAGDNSDLFGAPTNYHRSMPEITVKEPDAYKAADRRMSEIVMAIAPDCKDLSLGNFLLKVGTQLPIENDPKRLRPLRAIAAHAIALANKPVPKPNPTVVAKNAPAVKEFAEWLNSFDPDRALLSEAGWGVDDLDNPWLGREDGNPKVEGRVSDVVDQFNVKEFLRSPFFMQADHDGMTISRSALKSAILCYLEDTYEKRHGGHVDMEEEASELTDTVKDHLVDHGMMLTEDEMIDDDMLLPPEEDPSENDSGDEDGLELTDKDLGADLAADGAALMDDLQLTDEDILLPKNQKADLNNEVTKQTVVDPDSGEEVEPDGGYINRLKQLAGQRQGAPR